MRKKTLLISAITLLLCSMLSGCTTIKDEIADAVANNKDIKLTVDGSISDIEREPFTWVELGQMTNYSELRNTWDNKMGITRFDVGSKNGVMYVSLDGNWTDNNTLYNVFQNKEFVERYWKDSQIKDEISKAAMKQFKDIKNESTGLIASVNAYFNLVQPNKDGTSGLMNILSRAEAMAIICRADTPVAVIDDEERFGGFCEYIGDSEYNKYAYNVLDNSYLKTGNGGLNYETYKTPITRGEAVYILMNRYFPDELANNKSNNTLSDCKNAGNVAAKLGIEKGHAQETYELEFCLQNPEDGCPEEMYKALQLANQFGIISSTTKWNSPVVGGELLNMIVDTYKAIGKIHNYKVSAVTGANVGESLYIKEEEVPEKTEVQIGGSTIEEVLDISNLDTLFKVYGDEINMTDNEVSESYKIDGKYTFKPVDKWMQVDYCDYLNVRVGPDTSYRIIKSVPKGTKIHIVARCEENGWYRIIAENKIVYQCGVYFSDFEGSENYSTRLDTK